MLQFFFFGFFPPVMFPRMPTSYADKCTGGIYDVKTLQNDVYFEYIWY